MNKPKRSLLRQQIEEAQRHIAELRDKIRALEIERRKEGLRGARLEKALNVIVAYAQENLNPNNGELKQGASHFIETPGVKKRLNPIGA
jgi:hypothetical protein